MKTIYKYEIRPDRLRISMPKGAQVLTAREQFDSICIWAEVDTDKPMETRQFEVYGTGNVIPKADVYREYLGTAVLEGGALVFHVYEAKES